jgi:hypothetical protein
MTLMRTPQGRATPIEIEIAAIAIEIGKLPEIDFDHDFDFDIDTELPQFENKNALLLTGSCLTTRHAGPNLNFRYSDF